jgi:hypothetical protein
MLEKQHREGGTKIVEDGADQKVRLGRDALGHSRRRGFSDAVLFGDTSHTFMVESERA